MKADTVLMKQMNRQSVLNALKGCGKATKPELAKKTGLSVVTVNALVADMLSGKDILEGGIVPSNGGRPSRQYVFNKNKSHTAIVFGHQKDDNNLIRFLLINLAGEVVWRREAYIPQISIDSFAPYLDTMFAEYPPVSRIVFGLPGEEFEGVIPLIDYPALEGDRFIPFHRERYGVDVSFVNDINAMIYGYYSARRELKADTVVGLYFPRIYEPGAGIVIHEAIYTGKQNFAGLAALVADIPWLTMDYADPEAVTANIAQAVAIYACVLAPSRIVLYGDFLNQSYKERITRSVEKLLLGKFSLSLEISENIETDFQSGLIAFSESEPIVLESMEETGNGV